MQTFLILFEGSLNAPFQNIFPTIISYASQ